MQYQAYAQAPAPQYVGVGPRFLAAVIDGIIIGIVVGIISVILGANGSLLASLLSILLAFLYLIGLEATRGATLGKMILGLRVVKQDGSPIGWSEAIVRNLLRVVDGLFGYLVGAILIWTSPSKQRLGDRVAHTVVVKSR